MSGPKRIQRRRTKGWRMPEGSIYVGRPTKWGNPAYIGGTFSVGEPSGAWMGSAGRRTMTTAIRTRRDATTYFRSGLRTGMSQCHQPGVWSACQLPTDADVKALRGHDLACWCPLDQPCHADVLLELANGSAS